MTAIDFKYILDSFNENFKDDFRLFEIELNYSTENGFIANLTDKTLIGYNHGSYQITNMELKNFFHMTDRVLMTQSDKLKRWKISIEREFKLRNIGI